MKQRGTSKVLLLTIGVGDSGNLEDTLFVPLRKSIGRGDWRRVVLLPSIVSQEHAKELRRRCEGLPIESCPLPRPGVEDDADECFAHFDAVLAWLAEQGVKAEETVADFTRGTKAMTAALVLAAAGRGIRSLRYITGKRDQRGTVVPGSESIYDFRADRVTLRRDLDLSVRFLQGWQFRSAEALVSTAPLPEGCPQCWGHEAEWVRWLAHFWGAWDRFDHAEAVRSIDQKPAVDRPATLRRFLPDEQRIAFARSLSEPLPSDPQACAPKVRDRVADMLENGRRRLLLGELEDALLRAYRILEMIGQVRLYTYGQDSARVNSAWPPVREWLEYKQRQGRPVPVEKDGTLKLARDKVGSLLKHLKDPLAKELCNADKLEGIAIKIRNQSRLVHGFEAQAKTQAQPKLRTTYDQLERLFLQEDPGNKKRLSAARLPFNLTMEARSM